MTRLKLTVFLLFAALIFIHAEIILPAIFSDNMLMQQNTQVNIWGKASTNKTVTILTSWSKIPSGSVLRSKKKMKSLFSTVSVKS